MPNPRPGYGLLNRPQGGLLYQTPNFWEWLNGTRPNLPQNPTRADGIVSRSDYDPNVPNLTPGGGQEPSRADQLAYGPERSILPGEHEWQRNGGYGGLLSEMFDPANQRRRAIGMGLAQAGAGIAGGRGWGDSISRGVQGFTGGYASEQDRARDDILMQLKIAEYMKPDPQGRILTPQEEISLFGSDLPGTYQQTGGGDYEQLRGSAPESPQDRWELVSDPTAHGYPAGTIVSRNTGTNQFETEYSPPAPAQPRQPTDLDTKLAQLRQFYPNGGPDFESAVMRMIGAAEAEGSISAADAQIAALLARGMPREQAENIVYGFNKPMQNPNDGSVTMVDTTRGTATPVAMPPGLPRSVATDLTAQQTMIDPVIDEIAGLKNQITGQGVGLIGNALNVWNRTAGQGFPGSVNETNIEQRTQIAALRERTIQAISDDPKFSNQDRARIEQLLPSTGVFESAERARQNLDELEKLLRSRSATITQQLGGSPQGGGYQPPPGIGDPLAGAPQLPGSGGDISTMPVEQLLTLDPSQLDAAGQRALNDRLKQMGY